MTYRFPGESGYGEVTREQLVAQWGPAPEIQSAGWYREVLVVADIRWSVAGEIHPTAFGGRLAGAFRSRAIARDLAALRAGVMLTGYFGRKKLGRFRFALLRWLLRQMIEEGFYG